jgi:hypothetical protein
MTDSFVGVKIESLNNSELPESIKQDESRRESKFSTSKNEPSEYSRFGNFTSDMPKRFSYEGSVIGKKYSISGSDTQSGKFDYNFGKYGGSIGKQY